MSNHSHLEGIAHDTLSELINANSQSALQNSLNTLSTTTIDDETYEEAWAEYSKSKKTIITYTINRMINYILNYAPNVKYIVLYEDHSHDAPHGHVEALLDHDQHVISFGADWHDLEWSHEVDEYVWDIYNLGKEYFNLASGKRRLLIQV